MTLLTEARLKWYVHRTTPRVRGALAHTARQVALGTPAWFAVDKTAAAIMRRRARAEGRA